MTGQSRTTTSRRKELCTLVLRMRGEMQLTNETFLLDVEASFFVVFTRTFSAFVFPSADSSCPQHSSTFHTSSIFFSSFSSCELVRQVFSEMRLRFGNVVNALAANTTFHRDLHLYLARDDSSSRALRTPVVFQACHEVAQCCLPVHEDDVTVAALV